MGTGGARRIRRGVLRKAGRQGGVRCKARLGGARLCPRQGQDAEAQRAQCRRKLKAGRPAAQQGGARRSAAPRRDRAAQGARRKAQGKDWQGVALRKAQDGATPCAGRRHDGARRKAGDRHVAQGRRKTTPRRRMRRGRPGRMARHAQDPAVIRPHHCAPVPAASKGRVERADLRRPDSPCGCGQSALRDAAGRRADQARGGRLGQGRLVAGP